MFVVSLFGTEELDSKGCDMSLFCERRKRQLELLKNENARRLSMCAEMAFMEALKKAWTAGMLPEGPPVFPAETQEDEKGKPYFAAPGQYTGLFFNISHTEGMAAAAVADQPVGIDIEYLKRRSVSHAERILSADEAEVYKQLEDPASKNRFFLESWVRKESYLKRLGIGLEVFPRELEIKDGYVKMSKNASAYTESSGPAGAEPFNAGCALKTEIIQTGYEDYIVSVCV